MASAPILWPFTTFQRTPGQIPTLKKVKTSLVLVVATPQSFIKVICLFSVERMMTQRSLMTSGHSI